MPFSSSYFKPLAYIFQFLCLLWVRWPWVLHFSDYIVPSLTIPAILPSPIFSTWAFHDFSLDISRTPHSQGISLFPFCLVMWDLCQWVLIYTCNTEKISDYFLLNLGFEISTSNWNFSDMNSVDIINWRRYFSNSYFIMVYKFLLCFLSMIFIEEQNYSCDNKRMYQKSEYTIITLVHLVERIF